MSAFDIYIFSLCLIVLILLTSLSIFVVVTIVKSTCKLIRVGAEDEKILREANKIPTKGEKIGKVIDRIVSLTFAIVFLLAFALSTLVGCTKDVSLGSVPVLRVVNSDSMSKKNDKNDYLFDNNLGNQFDTFDLIITYEIPPEDQLKLYDIVVYRLDDMLIVHRIVEIQPPDSTHPHTTYYRLQGDAEARADVLPVKYDQMVAIYRGERIPFVGSFVKFMQSPAGMICILLVLFAMIAGPLVDKKLAKERAARLAIITAQTGEQSQSTAVEELVLTTNNYLFTQKVNTLTFKERLEKASDETKERYQTIVSYLKRIDGIRVINGKKFETYKSKSVPILRFAMRGKTLNCYVGLPCDEFVNSKYKFEDVSNVKAHANYPMRIRLTSNRKTRWMIELLENVVNKNGLTLSEEHEIIEEVATTELFDNAFSFSSLKKEIVPFKERLEKASEETKDRYETIVSFLKRIDGIRVINGKKFETYKSKSVPILRFAMRGKTLNCYVGLPCDEFVNSKYKFEDVSNVKAHANYPMRIKLTSNRKTRWMIELLENVVNKNGLTLSEEHEIIEEVATTELFDNAFSFSSLKKEVVPFKERLEKASDETKERYQTIVSYLKRIDGIRVINGKKFKTYKSKSVPILRFAMRGKTLNCYVGLPCDEFVNSKYKFEDVSNVRAHANYPMRIRLTSNRKTRWMIELLEKLLKSRNVSLREVQREV